MKQCKSCGGIYAPVLADGSTYAHVCPPLSVVELAAAVLAGKVALPIGETADVAILRRTYERANKRDENPIVTTPGAAPTMKAVGTGTIDVAAPVTVVTV